MRRFCVIFVSFALGCLCHPVPRAKYIPGMSREEALDIANRVLDSYPLVDGHNDLPSIYRNVLNNRMDGINLTLGWNESQTDIPRMRQGKMGAAFFVTYISCAKMDKDAVRAGLEQTDVIHQMIDMYPDDLQLVTTADGIEEAFAAGKIGSLIGLEGGHMIDSSVAALRMYYNLGVRYMSPTHTCSTPWAGNSNEDDTGDIYKGLSLWGQTLIVEMNRLGMLVDLAHVNKQTMLDALAFSKAPVIFSHSSVWALCNNARNVQNDVLKMLKDNGGLIQITFVRGFLSCFPTTEPADVSLVADHIEYIRDLIGIDHVGIGGDYDGTSSLPTGLEDVSKYPNLFSELVLRRWSWEDMQKLAGRNLVRVFREVERVRDEMAEAGIAPMYHWIPRNDLIETTCRTIL